MRKQSLRVVAMIAVALVTMLAPADRASAAGAVLIDDCQTLSDANTTYKLTTNLIQTLGNCLVIANNKITIDLQGHLLHSKEGGFAAITDLGATFDIITVKNGTVSGYDFGVNLAASTRVSVLGVNVKNLGAGITGVTGIAVGPQGLVKASETEGNGTGIQVGDRGQVQQCNSHDNAVGIEAFDNCLITMNTANKNGLGILTKGDKCTVSFNTANGNGYGIDTQDTTGHLITQNVALENKFDYVITCPSAVTNNTSTSGAFPSFSYQISGSGCHFVNNK